VNLGERRVRPPRLGLEIGAEVGAVRHLLLTPGTAYGYPQVIACAIGRHRPSLQTLGVRVVAREHGVRIHEEQIGLHLGNRSLHPPAAQPHLERDRDLQGVSLLSTSRCLGTERHGNADLGSGRACQDAHRGLLAQRPLDPCHRIGAVVEVVVSGTVALAQMTRDIDPGAAEVATPAQPGAAVGVLTGLDSDTAAITPATQDLYYPSHGVAAVESARRAAHHLDALNSIGRQGRPVEAAEVRIVQPQAVPQHQCLVGLGATREDRHLLSGRSRARDRKARHGTQELVDIGGLTRTDLFTVDHRDRRRQVAPLLTLERRGHDDTLVEQRWWRELSRKRRSNPDDRRDPEETEHRHFLHECQTPPIRGGVEEARSAPAQRPRAPGEWSLWRRRQVSWLPDRPTPEPSHRDDRQPISDPSFAVVLRFRTRLQWRGPRRICTGFPLELAP
jgi:hypothetical protein